MTSLMPRHTKLSITYLPISRLYSLLLSFALALMTGCSSPAKVADHSALQISEQPLAEASVKEKTEPAITFFYIEKTQSADELKLKTKSLAEQIATDAVKRAKLEIDGALILQYQNLPSMSKDKITAAIGFPVTGRGNRLPQYTIEKMPEFKCLTLSIGKAQQANEEGWAKLYQFAQENTYQLSGVSRTVVTQVGGSYKVELQLGVL